MIMDLSVGQSLGHIIGNVYPAFKSYKSLKSQERGPIRDMLMYWVTKAFFDGFESILSLHSWLPFYNYVRIGVLVWLQHSGAVQVYRLLIGPLLHRNEHEIDNFLRRGQNAAAQTLERSAPRIQQMATQIHNLLVTMMSSTPPSFQD
eukprot:gb/GECH01003832.1/.p1 GENE.gb/GECH01003832.1/~~gb/GECH01003832.1/.p1  ORF type:complete len:147 (+),score=16.78 gb/GECH01003832.1/:1-441(+)